MVKSASTKSGKQPVKRSVSSEIGRGGYVDVHQDMGINTYDISDYLIATIRGEESPESSRTETNAAFTRAALNSHVYENTDVAPVHKVTRVKTTTKDKLKTLWENTPRSGKALGALGALAVTATAIFAKPVEDIKDYYDDSMRESTTEIVAAANAVDVRHAVVTHERVDFNSVYFPIGGAGQSTPPVEHMRHEGYLHGMQIDPVFYSASIGPFVGHESMEQSQQGGVNYALPRVVAAIDSGKSIHIPAFSEGTGVQKELAWAIYDHYGYIPEGVTFTQIGGPYHKGGIFDSKFTNAVNPILDMADIDRDRALPPGVQMEFVYYGDDPWAGNGNENFLTYLKNFAGLAVGNHAIPSENDPTARIVVVRDNEGHLHKIFVRDQDVFITALQNAGIHVMDPVAATAAINAFFPQNYDPNSETPPRADVRAGLHFTAVALDKQFGTGDMIQKFVAGLPEEFKQFLDDGWNGINDVMDAVATAMADPTPENIARAFQVIGDTIQKVFGGISNSINTVQAQLGNDHGATAVANQVRQATGVDLASSFQSLLTTFNQPASQTQTQANYWLEAQASLNAAKEHAQAQAAYESSVALSESVRQAVNEQSQNPLNDVAEVAQTAVDQIPTGVLDVTTNAEVTSPVASVEAEVQTQVSLSPSKVAEQFGADTTVELNTPVIPEAPAPADVSADFNGTPAVQAPSVPEYTAPEAEQDFTPAPAPASAPEEAAPAPTTPIVDVFNTPAPAAPAPEPIEAPAAPAVEWAPAAPAPAVPEYAPPAPEPAPAPFIPALPAFEAPEPAPAPAPAPAPVIPQIPVINIFESLPQAPAPAAPAMPDLSSAPAGTSPLSIFG